MWLFLYVGFYFICVNGFIVFVCMNYFILCVILFVYFLKFLCKIFFICFAIYFQDHGNTKTRGWTMRIEVPSWLRNTKPHVLEGPPHPAFLQKENYSKLPFPDVFAQFLLWFLCQPCSQTQKPLPSCSLFLGDVLPIFICYLILFIFLMPGRAECFQCICSTCLWCFGNFWSFFFFLPNPDEKHHL